MAPVDALENRVVTRISHCCSMDLHVIGQCSERLNPNCLMSHVFAINLEKDRRCYVAHVERSRLRPVLNHRMLAVTEKRCGCRQRFGVGDIVGEGILVIESRISVLKRSDHREDGLIVLKCLHSPSAETSAITKSVNRKSDWQLNISGSQKVSVQ